MSIQKCSAGKDTYCQNWQPEFAFQSHMIERKNWVRQAAFQPPQMHAYTKIDKYKEKTQKPNPKRLWMKTMLLFSRLDLRSEGQDHGDIQREAPDLSKPMLLFQETICKFCLSWYNCQKNMLKKVQVGWPKSCWLCQNKFWSTKFRTWFACYY